MEKRIFKMSYLYTDRKRAAESYQEITKYDPRIVGTKEDQMAYRLSQLIAARLTASWSVWAKDMAKSMRK